MHLTPDLYQRIIAAKLFIDENFHLTIDLESIAASAFLSRFHFHRLFRQVYKMTPHRYVTKKRIARATELLAEEALTITEVCNEVGFESLGSFSILFKKEIGFPPQYFRNKAWLKKQETLEEPARFIPNCFIESYGITKSL